MKRIHFLLSLVGLGAVAKAQDGPVFGTIHNGRIPGGSLLPFPWAGSKPANNQCPVCGKMAKPFKRPTRHLNDGYKHTPGDSPFVAREINGREEPYGPTEQCTRCAHCNAAFFRDAE